MTLLFGLPRYRQVAEAYIAGLEARLAQGKPVNYVASVASFFLSRIDVLVDPLLERLIAHDGEKGELAKQVHGQVAISSAKVAYQMFKEIIGGERFKNVASQGGRVQRLLWASTGAKNPEYSDVKYVDSLIGPDTVNTVPLKTLDAYRDHGDPQLRLEDDVEQARWVMDQLPALGIDIADVTRHLENEGVVKFSKPFDKLMQTLEREISSRHVSTAK